ncbi:PREDICTED: uncharacterized protein LOC108366940 [Rhagoletis zephyria]|nr:PREDICTED: uncharacterized protein LOC108366940 [Rhagoletis zephyria]
MVFSETANTTTKLRVVFDGGNGRPKNISLNEELASGPPLQNDLPSIITRWRCHKIAFTDDLEKMFRQVMVCDEHQKFQCILWRDDVRKNISIYKLRTVTYGTTSASYLAIRVLRQLARDENSEFPLASNIFLNDSYVDDITSGTDSITDTIELHQQLSNLSKRGGFNLRKWNSNSNELMNVIPPENRDNADAYKLKDENFVKALGLYWEISEDHLCFKLNFSFASTVTKGSMLSDAAKLFDPLGWLAPVTIVAKLCFNVCGKKI